MTLVAIDAGHGSNTAGKRTVDGYHEHYINVKCAYFCEQYLQANGVNILRVAWNDLILDDDADVALSTRQSQIKKAKCDYSVSFHADAIGDGKTWNSTRGAETLISSTASAQKDSRKLAEYVQAELMKGTSQPNRGVKTQSLAMCNCTKMGTKGSILVEVGFMTNEYEAKAMKTDTFCKEQGEDVARGILKYLGKTPTASSPATTTNTSNSTTTKPSTSTQTTPTSSSTKYVYQGLDYSPVFYPTYYANKNADVKKAFGTDAKKLFEHFLKYGMKEGRQAIATFNVAVYKANNADLVKAFGNDLPSYYKHYCQYGIKEKRKCY